VKKSLPLLIFLVVEIFTLSLFSREFLTIKNLLETLRYAVELGIMAVPMTMIIATGGIDLSVASMLALTGILIGIVWKHTNNIWISSLVGLSIACGLGGINGLIITKMKIPPIVVTIATMAAYRGLANGLGGGRGITNFPDGFETFGQGSLLNLIPYSAFIMIVVAIVGYVVMEKSKLGRYITAIGYNEVGTYYSGIKVDKLKLMLYTSSGMIAGLAGIIYTARLGAAKANAFVGGELEVITAVVLGGTSVTGGENNITGTIISVLIITFLKNGLNLARIPHSVQTMLIGIILIFAIVTYSKLRGVPLSLIKKKILKS